MFTQRQLDSKLRAIDGEYFEGFQMVFSNGYTISVQFGKFNYVTIEEDGSVSTAEIAIIKPDGSFHRPGSWTDDVLARVTPDEVVSWMLYTRGL